MSCDSNLGFSLAPDGDVDISHLGRSRLSASF
jgi:hypothetical protein